MSFLELAKKRCSCRNFNDQQVPEETLQYILEAGRVAPTGVNKQPQHILVIRSKELLTLGMQTTPFAQQHAPVSVMQVIRKLQLLL